MTQNYFIPRLQSSTGFVLNPYDPCVANKGVRGKQLTIVWHVDNLKASHKSKEVVSKFIAWLKEVYKQVFEDGTGAM